MSLKMVPDELNARRQQVFTLYAAGYSIADIARYFEVTPANILSGFEAVKLKPEEGRIYECVSKIKKGKNAGGIEQKLTERDQMLSGLSEDEIHKLGFWKRPTAFQYAKRIEDQELALQTELRMIGFRKKEICRYMGYPSEDKVEAVRHNTDDFLCEQQKVALQLYDDKKNNCWTCREIIEYCGACIGRIIRNPKATKEKQEREPERQKRKEAKDRLQEKIFTMYQDEGMTQQQIAEALGTTRRTVITYLQRYLEKNGIPMESIKRSSKGTKNKVFSQNDLSVLRDHYLTINQEGKFVRKKGYTVAAIAKEMGFTEVTISKYIDYINRMEKLNRRRILEEERV